MPVLQTHRLTLREFEPEDVDALATIVSDAGTMRHYPMSFDRADVVDWILRNRTRYANDGYGLWAMVLKSTGELIGDCGLVRQSVDGTDELEIGYHVRRDLWGKGYATEAAQACREYAFANFKVDRLISLIRPENLVSRRIAEKNGMTIWKEVARANLLHYVYAIKRDQTYIAAISEDAMPKTAPAEFSLAQALLTSFDTNDRINHYMIENLPSEAWHAEPAQGKGRTIAAIVAHLHNVRVMWLKAAAKGSKIPEHWTAPALRQHRQRKLWSKAAQLLARS